MGQWRYGSGLMIGRSTPTVPQVTTKTVGTTNPGQDLVNKIRMGKK